MRRRDICLVLVAAISSPIAAEAQEGASKTLVLTDIQAAQLLITNGRLDDAKKLLGQLLKAAPEGSETLFLLGAVAVAEKDYETAISFYRRILVNQPNAERVRLELARAFFLKGDYDNAERQFRFARAGDVPDAVKSNIDQFLSAINRLRQWRFTFSAALAPDSNENAATSLSQVNIYGLPFALDANARRHSGIGMAGAIGGEWSPLVAEDLKARIGADAYRVEYGGGQFDDMTVSTYAGPQFLFPGWDISALATGFQRWYANRPYVKGAGGKLAVDVGITSDFQIGVAAGGQDISYYDLPAQNGRLVSLQAQAGYVLSPAAVFSLQAGHNRQDSQEAPYSYSATWFGAGYSQDLPLGFSAGIQSSYVFTDYDAPLAGFGITRADHALVLNLNLLNRRWDYHGFAPRFSWAFTDQYSNIGLYRYRRNQLQIGVTSQF